MFSPGIVVKVIGVLVLCLSLSAKGEAVVSSADASLEAFLLTYPQDRNAARVMLETVSAMPGLTAPQQIRLLSYKMLYLDPVEDSDAIMSVLDKMEYVSRSSQDPNVKTEVLAAGLQHFYTVGDVQRAATHIKPLELNVVFATDPRVQYVAWHTLADVRAWRGQSDKALAAYLSAFRSIEHDNSARTPVRLMHLRISMAGLHANMKNYDLAKTLLQAALDEVNNQPALEEHLPAIYTQLGIIQLELGEFLAAEKSYQAGLQIAKHHSDIGTQATLHNNLGDLYLRQGQLDSALMQFNASLTVSGPGVDPVLKALLMFNVGQVMVLQEQFEDGLSVMQEALSVLEKGSSQNDYLSYLQEMADAYHEAGQYRKEAVLLRQHNALSQALFQTERDKQINQLQEDFSAKEKEKEISELTQSNAIKALELDRKTLQYEVMVLLVLLIVMTAVLLWLFYRRVKRANNKLTEMNVKLADQSMRDPLTGLLNRRSLHNYMQEKQRDRRDPLPALTDGFILLDIDHFKHINDHYGHAAGDAVLIELAQRLRDLVRDGDLVLRWGGEEFLIVLRRVNIDDLMQFASRVLDSIAKEPVHYQKLQLNITASAGTITFPFTQDEKGDLDWQKTLRLADNALYLGKVDGRNRAYGFYALSQPYEQIAQALESDFSHAVEQGLVVLKCVEGYNKTAL